jgi:hypothetical protein
MNRTSLVGLAAALACGLIAAGSTGMAAEGEPAALGVDRATEARFLGELKRMKPALDRLSEEEREQRVKALQDRFDSNPAHWAPELRRPANADEVAERQRVYAERVAGLQGELEGLSPQARVKKLEDLKKEVFEGIE